MRIFFFLWMLLFAIPSHTQEKPKILFFQTNWGNADSWDAFCKKTKESGYDGIEIWFPEKLNDRLESDNAIKKHGLEVIYLAGTDKNVDFEMSLVKYTERLISIAQTQAMAINCHTGSDFFTFQQNQAFIDAANDIAKEYNIPIYHETHRGRFSYNLPDTNKYLDAIPDLRLTLDISHWMVVHESLLENQTDALETVVDRTRHIHARVGHAEGPQVNDPEAPEWQGALERHLEIWEKIIRKSWKGEKDAITVTTEFGPPTYMPTLPYTQVPVADQWKANVFIMNALKKRLIEE